MSRFIINKSNSFLPASFLFVVLLSLYSCSQTATGIQKTFSFYKINTPGNIPVDDNGNTIGKIHDTSTVVYFETAVNIKPVINAMVVHRKSYKVSLTQITSRSEEAGILLESNKPVTVKARTNKLLWKAERGNEIPGNNSELYNSGYVYLLIRYEGRDAVRVIKKQKELVPELHY